MLIDAAVDLSLKNSDGNTVLHQIALHEEVLGSDFKGGIIDLLLAKGIDINAQNQRARRPSIFLPQELGT
jgi:ankyrin repeat protein